MGFFRVATLGCLQWEAHRGLHLRLAAEAQSVLIITGASMGLRETTSGDWGAAVGLECLPGEIATRHSLRGAVEHGVSHRRPEDVGGN